MSNTIVEYLIKSEGYCCTYAYLRFKRRYNTAAIAARLGVAPRTIRYQKAKVKAGEGCQAREGCQHADCRFSHELLTTRPEEERVQKTILKSPST